MSEGDAFELLRYAYDKGVQVFDTAPVYGFGESERRIGKALKDFRDKVFLISKSGVTWHSNMRIDMTNCPKVTQKMIEQSLRDLQSDYIDLYMVHWPDSSVDIRHTLEVYEKAKDQGKIKHIGLCNTFAQDFKKAKEVSKIEVIQSELNIFNRSNLEFATEDSAFMSWGTLDKGIITGKVNKERKFEKADCRSWAPWWKSSPLEQKYKAMEEILPKLEKEGFSGLDLALSHNLSNKHVSSVLCGVKSKVQLDTIVDSLQKKIPATVINECIEIAQRHLNA